MLIKASQIIHLPVKVLAEFDHNAALVKEIIIDPKQLKVLGFLLFTGLFKPELAIVFHDVRQITPQFLATSRDNNILPPKEIVRLNQAKKLGVKIFEQLVKTKSGKLLGRVEDYLIEKETGHIPKIYVRADQIRMPLSSDLIIPRSAILKITSTIIIVKDSVLEEKLKAKRRVLSPVGV